MYVVVCSIYGSGTFAQTLRAAFLFAVVFFAFFVSTVNSIHVRLLRYIAPHTCQQGSAFITEYMLKVKTPEMLYINYFSFSLDSPLLRVKW